MATGQSVLRRRLPTQASREVFDGGSENSHVRRRPNESALLVARSGTRRRRRPRGTQTPDETIVTRLHHDAVCVEVVHYNTPEEVDGLPAELERLWSAA
jgi:hypothetical protein